MDQPACNWYRNIEKHYVISVAGGGPEDEAWLVMSRENLQAVFDEMPTLGFLLVGRDGMKPKELKRADDGTPVVTIPKYLNISLNAFRFMLQFVLGSAAPLSYFDNRTVYSLLDTVTTLGGCKNLEARLTEELGSREIKYQRDYAEREASYNPMTPQEDIQGKFIWQVKSNTDDHSHFNYLESNGYSATAVCNIANLSYYRKEKERQT